jgi:pimeloyl-ACP methyl ester carboxylesterase
VADQTRRRRDRLEPVLTQRSIRRNTVRVLRAVFAGKDLLRRAAERLPGFREPALIVWAKGDRVMPPEHGRRLAGLLPHAQLIEIDDSYALIPLGQPARPAQLIADVTRAPGSTARSHPHQPRP